MSALTASALASSAFESALSAVDAARSCDACCSATAAAVRMLSIASRCCSNQSLTAVARTERQAQQPHGRQAKAAHSKALDSDGLCGLRATAVPKPNRSFGLSATANRPAKPVNRKALLPTDLHVRRSFGELRRRSDLRKLGLQQQHLLVPPTDRADRADLRAYL